jgi:hypothetical protein
MKITNQVFVDRIEGTTVDRVPTVGDVVLLRPRYDHEPVITGNVSRTSKTQFRVTGSDGKEYGPFKMESWNQHDDRLEDGSPAGYDSTDPATRFHFCRFDCRSKYDKYHACYFNTDFARGVLQGIRDQAIQRAEAKQAASAKRQQEYEERVTAELAEVRAAMNAPVGMPLFRTQDTMPDGSRVYTIDLPVYPKHAERKKGWERLIVRCWDGEDYDFAKYRETGDEAAAKIKVVESAYTYCNGSSGSFSSVSTSRFSSDEEAVWDACRRQYHSW